MEQPILKAKGLTMRYHSALALDNLDLELPQGKIVGLLGPNGSGKTTFIKLAAGLLTPTSGEITIGGNKIGTETKAVVSYLPDRPYFSRQLRVEQQMDFFQDFYADFDRARAEAMLTALNISTKAKFKALSKGNQEKVQLVLVMSRRAKLYLLDEPIGGVDPAARDYILNTIITNYDPRQYNWQPSMFNTLNGEENGAFRLIHKPELPYGLTQKGKIIFTEEEYNEVCKREHRQRNTAAGGCPETKRPE